jgi:hypothetical protein
MMSQLVTLLELITRASAVSQLITKQYFNHTPLNKTVFLHFWQCDEEKKLKVRKCNTANIIKKMSKLDYQSQICKNDCHESYNKSITEKLTVSAILQHSLLSYAHHIPFTSKHI